jgi:hypothetical protein
MLSSYFLGLVSTWRRTQNIPPKRRLTLSGLHDVISLHNHCCEKLKSYTRREEFGESRWCIGQRFCLALSDELKAACWTYIMPGWRRRGMKVTTSGKCELRRLKHTHWLEKPQRVTHACCSRSTGSPHGTKNDYVALPVFRNEHTRSWRTDVSSGFLNALMTQQETVAFPVSFLRNPRENTWDCGQGNDMATGFALFVFFAAGETLCK